MIQLISSENICFSLQLKQLISVLGQWFSCVGFVFSPGFCDVVLCILSRSALILLKKRKLMMCLLFFSVMGWFVIYDSGISW